MERDAPLGWLRDQEVFKVDLFDVQQERGGHGPLMREPIRSSENRSIPCAGGILVGFEVIAPKQRLPAVWRTRRGPPRITVRLDDAFRRRCLVARCQVVERSIQ